jgi:ABC-type multidrug transport system permease subunit
MARLALLIGWKDCLVRFQSRLTLIFVVALPLAMTIVSGLAFQGLEVTKIPSATVALVEAQPSEIWKPPAQQPPDHIIVNRELTEQAAEQAVKDKEIDGAVVIGPRLHDTVSTRLYVHRNESPQRILVEAAFAQLVERLGQGPRAAVSVQVEPPVLTGVKDEFDSFTQAVLGNGVMFILLNCITMAGITIVRERRQNTLARLLISPVSRWTLLTGKMLGVFFIGLAQALVVFGFGAALRKFDGPTTADTATNLVGIALITLLLIAMACAMGLVVSTLARREETAESLGVPIAIFLTAMGGGMFPVDRAPPWMQTLAKFLPTGQAMDAYYKLIKDHKDLSDIGPNLLVLAIFAAVFFAFGVSRLRWE